MIMCCIFGYKFNPSTSTNEIWPILALILIWDFWYNACDVLNWEDISPNWIEY